MADDTQYQNVYRGWAAEKFGLPVDEIERVEFKAEYDGGYSDMTPGMGAVLEISVYGKNRKLLRSTYEDDYAETIHEITRFAVSEKVTP